MSASESTDNLQSVLEEYLNLPGIIAALLVSDQGIVVASVDLAPVDVEAIAAHMAEAVKCASRLGKTGALGEVNTLLVRFAGSELLAVPFAPDLTLVLVSQMAG